MLPGMDNLVQTGTGRYVSRLKKFWHFTSRLYSRMMSRRWVSFTPAAICSCFSARWACKKIQTWIYRGTCGSSLRKRKQLVDGEAENVIETEVGSLRKL